MLKVAIGADDAATAMKNRVKQHLQDQGIEVVDFSHDVAGNDQMYPDIAFHLACAIRDGQFERGILVCGTGIGMAIVANKVPGVRAAQCHDVYSAERARKSNNAQIMTMGARVIGEELALMLVDSFMASEFEAGRSGPKVSRIDHYEAQIRAETASGTAQ
ncbi:RpiB/LacA/LacB family sugar-phosphate isomerase [[Erwinia] mediterraneensis]|uniref:RpiB/LacA/LacB family sugar-phosphate isomerase n=1 Tax=[Erwinia] mediterraneensis TaxID=2161819 RepID=UPI001030E2A5|nr:RpiB/LacA/LacB family sugar-phosphate isomerase [[Erwinia] mediterraneensis]